MSNNILLWERLWMSAYRYGILLIIFIMYSLWFLLYTVKYLNSFTDRHDTLWHNLCCLHYIWCAAAFTSQNVCQCMLTIGVMVSAIIQLWNCSNFCALKIIMDPHIYWCSWVLIEALKSQWNGELQFLIFHEILQCCLLSIANQCGSFSFKNICGLINFN